MFVLLFKYIKEVFMKIIIENKELVIFYIAISLVMCFWVGKVEKDNDKILYEKNSYMLIENI